MILPVVANESSTSPSSSSRGRAPSLTKTIPADKGQLAAVAADGDGGENNDGARNMVATASQTGKSLRPTKREARTGSTRSLLHSCILTSRLSLILLALVPLILGVSAVACGTRVDYETRDAAIVFDGTGPQSFGGAGGIDGGGRHDVEITANDDDDDKHALIRRAAADGSALPSSSSSSSSSSSPASSTKHASSSGTPTARAGNAQATSSIPNPTAFDTVSLSFNLSSSCSGFLTQVVTDTEFTNCLPLSGFIRDSNSFFEIMKQGAFNTTAIMVRICAVNFDRCAAVMDGFSGQLRGKQYCKADYDAQNPVAMNMLTTLITYEPLHTAGCLMATDGDYCFVDAAANTDRPEDLYIYSLPLGNPLPSGSHPTCNDCLSRTMSAFRAVAGNSTQPLSKTYIPAAKQLNLGCGSNFVNTQVEKISSARVSRMSPAVLLVALAVTALYN